VKVILPRLGVLRALSADLYRAPVRSVVPRTSLRRSLTEWSGRLVGVVELHRLSPDDWRLWRIARLQALEDAPYAFGTSLSEWQGEGDLESRWRKRLGDVPFNVVATVDGRPVGQVSGTDLDDQGSVGLISMWVAPIARGSGVGEALIGAVIVWAEQIGAREVSLEVKEGNSHAIALYERIGFVDRGISADTPDERTMTRLLVPS